MSTTLQKVLGVVVVVCALLGALAFFGVTLGGAGHQFGLATSPTGEVVPNQQWFTNGINVGQSQQFIVSSTGQVTIGSAGTPLTTVINGTCNAATAGLPLAATTTASFTCAAPGAVAGENVDVNLNANPTAYGAFVVIAPVTTTNSITFSILNDTGASTSSFPLATTSVAYTITK